MRGGPPAYKGAHNVFWPYETATAAPCTIALTALGDTPVIHELHYGYEADPIAANPYIWIRNWGGSVWYWMMPVVSKGPHVHVFPGGIWLPQGVIGKIELVSGGAGIVGYLTAMVM